MKSTSNFQSYYMGYFCRPVSAKENCRKSFSNIHQDQSKILSKEFQMKNKTVFQSANQEVDGQVKEAAEFSVRYNETAPKIDRMRNSNNFEPYNQSQRQKGRDHSNSNDKIQIKRPRSSVQRSYSQKNSQLINKVSIAPQNSYIRLNSENLSLNRHKTNQERKKMYQSYSNRKNSQKNRNYVRHINSAKQRVTATKQYLSRNVEINQSQVSKMKNNLQKLNLLLNLNSEGLVYPYRQNKDGQKEVQKESLRRVQNTQPIFNHFPQTYNITQEVFSKSGNSRVFDNNNQNKKTSVKQNKYRSHKDDSRNLNYTYSMVVQEFIRPKIIKIIENQEHRQELTQKLMERALALTVKKTPIHKRPNKSENQVKFAKSNRPKRGLSIGVYRTVEKVTHQRQIIQKDVNMIITSSRNMKPKVSDAASVASSMNQSQIMNLLIEKRKKHNEKSRKKIVYLSKEKTPSVQQIDPKPW